EHVRAKCHFIAADLTDGDAITRGNYAATKHAMKASADSLRDEVNASGVPIMSLFLWANCKASGSGRSLRQRASIPARTADPAHQCRGPRSFSPAAAAHERANNRYRAAPDAKDVIAVRISRATAEAAS